MTTSASDGDPPVSYREDGDGPPLLLLHPGGTDGRAFSTLSPRLASRFRVIVPDRSGHGRTPDAPGPFSFAGWARETAALAERLAGGPVAVLGYSDGAIVGLTLALHRPDLVRRLAFVAGVFHADGWEPGVVDALEDPPAFMGEAYAEVSPDGRDHWPVVVAKAAALHREEPAFTEADLGRLDARTLVMVADDDIITLEHTIDLYRAIPNAELAVVPGTSHFLLQEKPAACNAIIVDFLTKVPVPTVAPVRRATTTNIPPMAER